MPYGLIEILRIGVLNNGKFRNVVVDSFDRLDMALAVIERKKQRCNRVKKKVRLDLNGKTRIFRKQKTMKVTKENSHLYSIEFVSFEVKKFETICEFFDVEPTDFIMNSIDDKLESMGEVLAVILSKLQSKLDDAHGD